MPSAAPDRMALTDNVEIGMRGMYTVKLANEFLHGPVCVLDDDGISAADGSLSLVEDDPVVRELNDEAGSLFDSYYEFDSHGQPCWFNEDKQRTYSGRMLSLVARLNARLAEINGSSYVIEDLETPFLMNL